jgi:hypothetical protein
MWIVAAAAIVVAVWLVYDRTQTPLSSSASGSSSPRALISAPASRPTTVATARAPAVAPVQSSDTEPPTQAPATLTAVRDLEALLPDELGGVKLLKGSYTGTDMMQQTTEAQAKPLLDWLKALGKKPADFAQATAGDQAGQLKVFVVAYRIKGVAADKYLPSFLDAVKAQATAEVTTGKASLGGKKVSTFQIKGQEAFGTNYYYAKGDDLFLVQTPDEALATEALSKLP